MATRPTLSPTVRHKRLTAELRRLRAESGLTREAVAERFDWHPTKITRIEKGQWSRLNLRDVRELLETYGVTDESQRESLVQLARDVRQRGWWQSYSNVLPNEYTHFIGLEAEAASVRNYEQVLVPGLLQTAAYHRAIANAFLPTETPEGVDQRIAIRLERQRRVTEERSLQYSAILGEGVVLQRVGSPEITAEQLRYLADVGELPNVMVQVMPYDSGAHPAMVGAFAILGFPEPIDPDVVYLDNTVSAVFLEAPDGIAFYVQAFDYLRATALSPKDSRDMLRAAAEELT